MAVVNTLFVPIKYGGKPTRLAVLRSIGLGCSDLGEPEPCPRGYRAQFFCSDGAAFRTSGEEIKGEWLNNVHPGKTQWAALEEIKQ
jgi:hypothetical protein